MGQLLSAPVKDKSITLVHGKRTSHVIGEMQGYRASMEDAYCDTDIELTVGSLRIPVAIYGVFDGHGGGSASKYLSENLSLAIVNVLQLEIDNMPQEKLDKLVDSTNRETATLFNWTQLMRNVFQNMDAEFFKQPNNNCGSTAVVTVLIKNIIVTANSGDSRTVLSRSGFAKACSFDHKPKNLGELLRIHYSGGYVANNRVNGILALSRAMGDFSFKLRTRSPPEMFQVSVCPDVIIHELLPHDEFFIMACDGIWDCLKPQEVVRLVRHYVSLGKHLDEIATIILDKCIDMANTTTGIGFDNMTIIIVALLPPSLSSVLSTSSSSESIPATVVTQSEDSLHYWLTSLKTKILDEKFGTR